MQAVDGETIAAALASNGIAQQAWGKNGDPRGVFCGMGVCHDCLVTIDGLAGQRACLSRVTAGLDIRLGREGPLDLYTVSDLAALPAAVELREIEVAVVGAGPGGLSAARAAARAGLSVEIVDERPKPGGQFLKAPLPGSAGANDRRARERVALLNAVEAAGVRLTAGTLVWGAFREEAGGITLGLMREGEASTLRCRWLVIATGAYERPQVTPGWTLPGVMTAGACQALVRGEGVAPGRRVLFAGHGPLQAQVAAELRAAGGRVVALVDLAAPFGSVAAAARLVAASPRLAIQGLAAVARLRTGGTPLLWRHGLRRLEGARRVERAIVAPLAADGAFAEGADRVFEVDAVCLGVGFEPSSELARLLGCEETDAPGHLARMDDGATSQPDIFVVGEAGGFGGAEVAKAQGLLAGAAIATAAGRPTPKAGGARALARARRFQRALWAAYDAPAAPHSTAPDTTICRCEGLQLSHLRAVIATEGVSDLATLKRLTRAGMGRCQGRYCAGPLAALLNGGAPVRPDIAPQMPLRPVPLAALAVEKPEWGGHKRSHLPPDRAGQAPPLPREAADVVVIGAGIAGISTALFLAREGLDVMVLDAGAPNAMASGGNAGSLHVQLLSFDFGAKAEAGGSPAALTLPLQRDAVALWRALETETGRDFEMKITGGVMVAEDEAGLRFLEQKTAIERAHGVDCTVVGKTDLERLEPNLSRALIGAAYCPQEGKINPLVATQGVLAAALGAGAIVMPHTTVRAIGREGASFRLATSRGPLRAGRIVNAAGAFASRIGRMLDVDVPVFGAPLQMIVTEAAAPLLTGLVAHADRHLTLKQAANGALLIGGGWTATLDPVRHHPRPIQPSLEGNLWAAQHVVPLLRRAHVVRSWAAMNVNIDGAPILGQHPRVPGFYNAVSSNGYTLGPLLGRITADLLRTGRADPAVAAFGIERFG